MPTCFVVCSRTALSVKFSTLIISGNYTCRQIWQADRLVRVFLKTALQTAEATGVSSAGCMGSRRSHSHMMMFINFRIILRRLKLCNRQGY